MLSVNTTSFVQPAGGEGEPAT